MTLISDNDLLTLSKMKFRNGRMMLPLIRYILKVKRINSIYSEHSNKKGPDFTEAIIKELGIKIKLSEGTPNNIPLKGPFILISNHPLGMIDGLILLNVLGNLRPDFKILSNFHLLRIAPLKDRFLPVNPFEDHKSVYSSYKGIKGALSHLENGNCLGIFPAGEVSCLRKSPLGIYDREWQEQVIKLIMNSKVQVIPAYIHGHNSRSFYLAGLIHPTLRTLMLPSEALNKHRCEIIIHFGRPISIENIENFKMISSLTKYLRTATYMLNQHNKPVSHSANLFGKIRNQQQTIAAPVSKELLLSDIDNFPDGSLLISSGQFSVYCVKSSFIPHLIREIGRVREITFREAGEGTNKSTDIDKFDIYYYHLFIWDNYKEQIVGSYRIGKGKDIMAHFGRSGFYTSTLFRTRSGLDKVLENSLELGRSFIAKEYQRQHLVLLLLWRGIFQFLQMNIGYRYLIGSVSISNSYSLKSKSLIVQYLKRNHSDYNLAGMVRPVKNFRIPVHMIRENEIILNEIDNNIKSLESYLNVFQPGFNMPVLLRKYLQMNATSVGFNIDTSFNNCLDALMILDINKIPFEMRIQLSKGIRFESGIQWSPESRYNMSQVYN